MHRRVYASVLSDDFATMIAISELNPDVIGEDGFHAAAANCTLRSAVIEVPWFEGAQSTLPHDSTMTRSVRSSVRCRPGPRRRRTRRGSAARPCRVPIRRSRVVALPNQEPTAPTRRRSWTWAAEAATALRPAFCTEKPLSCGIIQQALEKSPGLRFVNGEWRHT